MQINEIITFLMLMTAIIMLASIKHDIKLMPKRVTAGRRKVLVDTSVLIDGRILSLCKTGFIGDELMITKSVIGELQLLADSGDADKRSRARYGLDVVTELQALENVEINIFQDEQRTPEGVDNRLVSLAKANGFMLLTGDYNLNKVATIEGIQVLNINELVQSVRMQVLPGEKISLKLTQPGQSPDQAVGYLEDGTMVVVSNAKKFVGKVVEVEITRSIQTDAGKMLFAETKSQANQVAKSQHRNSAKPEQRNNNKPEPKKRFNRNRRLPNNQQRNR